MKDVSDSCELRALVHHAELLIETGQLIDALALYDRIIQQSRPASHLLQRRGWLRRLTGEFDGSIADYDRAIELSPDDAGLYCDRGACLAHRMSTMPNLDGQTRKESLERVIADYRASVERDPAHSSAWLALLEAHLLQHDWDTAIADYALCRPYINTAQYRLVRAWLGCLALCLVGDPVEEEDKAPLYDMSIRMRHTSWCVAEIDSLLVGLVQNGYDNAAVACATELHQQFLNHFVETPIRAEA